LEAEVLGLMTGWAERYRREAETRFARLDGLLADLDTTPKSTKNPKPRRTGPS
jgi:hypothetical protein